MNIEKEVEIVFVGVCNANGVCDGEENYQNCPQDCVYTVGELADVKKLTERVDYLAILVAAAIILSIIIIGLVEISRISYHKQQKLQYILQLQDYIMTNLKRGYKKQKIKQKLLKEGWKKEVVDKAFKNLKIK